MSNLRNFSVYLFLILLLVAPAFAQTANVSDLSSQAALVSEFEINGLKVLVKRRSASPTVAAGLFLRGGVRNLTKETAGVENMMLSVATEASRRFPRAVLRRELARTGTQIGGGSNRDFGALSVAATRADFDRAWSIFTDIALNPTFLPADVERIRQQTLTGLRERNSNADAYLEELSEQAVFKGHPYENETSGTIENITKFTAADLRAFHRNAMQTSKLLLVIVGDLDAETLKPRIAAAFGRLPSGNYVEKPLPALRFDKPAVEITERELPTNYVQGTFAAPAPGDADIYAMRVATTILSERIREEVRDRRSLSYAPSASLDNRAANTAGIYVSAVDANQAVAVMLDEIKRLQTELVDEYTISGVVGQYLTTYYVGQETNGAQVANLATTELVGGGWRNASLVLDKTRQVKPADVRRVAQKYIRNIRFAVLGDPNNINREIFTRL